MFISKHSLFSASLLRRHFLFLHMLLTDPVCAQMLFQSRYRSQNRSKIRTETLPPLQPSALVHTLTASPLPLTLPLPPLRCEVIADSCPAVALAFLQIPLLGPGTHGISLPASL